MLSLAFAVAAHAAPTLAVSYFDTHLPPDRAGYAPMGKGLADMLITDLFGVSSIRVVEREALNAVLGELELGETRFVDPATAVKVGHLLSAQYVLTGGITIASDAMRVDARVFAVETGAIVSTRRVEGPTSDFFAVEKELVDALVEDLNLTVSAAERSKLRRNPTQNLEAFVDYATGLEAQDRGDPGEAARLFEEALAADPAYAAAKTQLERVKALMGVARQEQVATVNAELATLDPKSPQFGQRVFDLLLVPGTDARGIAQTIAVLRRLVDEDLSPVVGSGLGAIYPETNALAAFALHWVWDAETVELLPPVFPYLLRKYPQDRLLTSSSYATSPAVLERQIALLKQSPATFASAAEATGRDFAPYAANRAAAQALFRAVAAKGK